MNTFQQIDVRGVHMRVLLRLVVLTENRKRMILLTFLTFVSLC